MPTRKLISFDRDNISFRLGGGEMATLPGVNGSGKSPLRWSGNMTPVIQVV